MKTVIFGQLDTDSNTHVPLKATSDGQLLLTQRGQTLRVGNTLTRPANVTAYTANDAVTDSTTAPAMQEFVVGAVVGGGGYITGIVIATDAPSIAPRIRAWFTTNSAGLPIGPTNDNEPAVLDGASLVDAESGILGYIDLPAMITDGSGGSYSQDGSVRMPFKCEASDTKIYMQLQTLDAFTPSSAQKIRTILTVEQS
jgi:hypothetical protein